MICHYVKSVFKKSIFIFGLLTTSSVAMAAPEVRNATLDVSTSDEIVVIAEDGETYNKLLPTDLTFTGYIGASMRRGKAQSFAVFSGVCNDGLCGTPAFKELTHSFNSSSGPDLSESDVSFTFSTDKFPQLLSNNVQASRIFAACNDHMSGNQASETFTHNLRLTLGIFGVPKSTKFETGRGTLVYTNDFPIPVTIRCQSLSSIQAAEKPKSVKLIVKKLGKKHSCPRRIEVRTRIRYAKPTTARFRFVHNGKRTALIEIKARKIKADDYLVERVRFYNVNPGTHRFRLRLQGGKNPKPKTINVGCGPFQPTAMWMTLSQQKKASCTKRVTAKIRVDADQPGSVLTKIKNQAGVVMAIESIKVKRQGTQYVGRLTKVFDMGEIDTQLIAESSNDPGLNSGWQPLKVTCLEALKGTLSFQGKDFGRCPRKVKVAFAMQTSTEGRLKYHVACTGGRKWAGKIKAHKTGPDTYIAAGVKSFTIKRHEKVSCALKGGPAGQVKLLTMAGHSFSCDKGGSDDLTVAPDPTHDEPKQPAGFVAEPKKCKRNERRIRGRCVRIVIDCKRGFKLVRGKCVREPVRCKPNEKRVRGRCVPIVIDCKRGFKLVRGKCVRQPVKCKPDEKRVRGKCVKAPISIRCKRGYVRRGRTCVKKPGRVIKCKANQRRIGKRCVCKRGYKPFRGRCVKPAKRVKPKLNIKKLNRKALRGKKRGTKRFIRRR